jgi:hypothetical protein
MAGAMAGRWLPLPQERPRLLERPWCHGAQLLLHSQLQASWDVSGAVDMDPHMDGRKLPLGMCHGRSVSSFQYLQQVSFRAIVPLRHGGRAGVLFLAAASEDGLAGSAHQRLVRVVQVGSIAVLISCTCLILKQPTRPWSPLLRCQTALRLVQQSAGHLGRQRHARRWRRPLRVEPAPSGRGVAQELLSQLTTSAM